MSRPGRSPEGAGRKPRLSLKMGLITTIVICWLVPILIVVTVASTMLEHSYRTSVLREIDDAAKNGISQVQMRLGSAINGSKSVSYDGVIRNAYRKYQSDGMSFQLFRTSRDYLAQTFSRDDKYRAVFISFWDSSIAQPYVTIGDTTSYQIAQVLPQHTKQILTAMADADTDIRFLYLDGELYMARNLLDSSFTSYATVVMLLDSQNIFGVLSSLSTMGSVRIALDDCCIQIDSQKNITADSGMVADKMAEFSAEVDGHTLTVAAPVPEFNLWADNPWLGWEIGMVALMVLPLLAVIVFLFTRCVTRPIQTLADAHKRLQSGQRGYQIESQAPTTEFETLYANFNAMSAELKGQFERSFLEQQATQRAQIKALQSQINPHFLNNTLEIINWEARLADNERVSAMIEALSTMLDAALDRDGHSQIPLKQELVYVDAYLYITRERLGEGFQVHKDIEEDILNRPIPKLILQPIVENAVEHDIVSRREGHLWVRCYQREGHIYLEVEHDGQMSDEDQENIRKLLSEGETGGGSVGLRNVHQRLRLIYGTKAALRIEQTRAGSVLAQIRIPQEENHG